MCQFWKKLKNLTLHFFCPKPAWWYIPVSYDYSINYLYLPPPINFINIFDCAVVEHFQFFYQFLHPYFTLWDDNIVIVLQTSSSAPSTSDDQVSNCREMLDERLQVQWFVQGEWLQITLSARIREDQYMAFGISGEEGR